MYVEVPVYYLKQWNEYLKSLRVSNTRLHKQYLLAVPILQDIVKNEYYSGYICVESTVYYIKQWNKYPKSLTLSNTRMQPTVFACRTQITPNNKTQTNRRSRYT
jgi:hypothetical protein